MFSKIDTIRGQNPADPIFSPDSDLLRGAEAAGATRTAEEQPGGAAAKTPPTLASGCLAESTGVRQIA